MLDHLRAVRETRRSLASDRHETCDAMVAV